MDRYFPKLSESGQHWARFLGLLIALGLLVWIVLVLRAVLTPIVAALALAYILNPAVTWLDKRCKIGRVTSISVGLAILIVAGAALLAAGTAQIVQLAGDIPAYASHTFQWLDETIPGFLSATEANALPATAPSETPGIVAPAPTETYPVPRVTPDQPGGVRELARSHRDELIQLAREHGLAVGRSVVSYVGRAVSSVFYWISLTVLLPLYTFFFLLRFNEIIQTVRDHLPAAYRPTVVRVVTTADAAMSSFFRGRLLVCVAVGLLTGLGWLAVGVPYNLALGALAGTLNLVPFLSVLALPPALLLTYFNAAGAGENWVVAVTLVLIVYLAVQAVESFILTPTIQAKAAGLHPITTVIVLLIGGELAGLLGMLLAIPIASTLKSLATEYLLPELRRLAATKQPAVTDETQARSASTGQSGAQSPTASADSDTHDAEPPQEKP
jgi:predicted PurR-regulated permease PerM